MKKPKEDPGTEIDCEKYFNAQTNWVVFWAQQTLKVPSFGQFLGLTGGPLLHRRHRNRRYTMKLRASAVRKIEKLSGPHWYALLKAYQIRKQKCQTLTSPNPSTAPSP